MLRGHCAYYVVPTSIDALDVFGKEVTHRWFKALRRRVTDVIANWMRMNRLAEQ